MEIHLRQSAKSVTKPIRIWLRPKAALGSIRGQIPFRVFRVFRVSRVQPPLPPRPPVPIQNIHPHLPPLILPISADQSRRAGIPPFRVFRAFRGHPLRGLCAAA